MKKFGLELRAPETEGREKHVPVIKSPSKVKAGEIFDVTVVVGEEVAHPNTVAHHIKWIQVYAKSPSKELVHLGTFDFGPTYVEPRVTFPVKLEESAEIYALEYCNIHGVWESSQTVEVE